MLRSKSRSGYLEIGEKKHSSFLIRTISGSKICRGDALASQVAKEAVVSVDRKSISLSENRIVKAAMMQKQMSDLEEELKDTKARLDEAEREKNRVISELNAGLSSKKAEQVFSELKVLKDSLLNAKKEIESREKEMKLLNSKLESAKAFEAKLAERDTLLEQLKKELNALKDSDARKIRELEDQVAKAQQSESNMLESLMLQTQQITQTKMELEESKLEVVSLYEQLEKGGQMTTKPNFNYTSPEMKALKDEITQLKIELKFAREGEAKSKKAMDGLASALQEVATEASVSGEKLKLTEAKVTELTDELEQLKEQLELQRETSERLRVEAEEAYLTWSAKEMGFVRCIKEADEESAAAKHENHRLKEALVSAESTTRTAREEAFKLRDILKQALNESNVAKEASNIARSENSELKDLLAEKEDALHFLTKENERLRINEVAARENVKEFKRLLAAKAEVHKLYEDKEENDDYNSPLSSLYEDHLDGRTTPRQTYSFDLDDLKAFNKDDDLYYRDVEESVTDIAVREDPEKAEALKGSIFDMAASPRSEPQTPRIKPEHRRAASIYTDAGGVGQSEEFDNASSSGHPDDTDDRSYYSRKKLFKKIGELIVGKPTGSKKDAGSGSGSTTGTGTGTPTAATATGTGTPTAATATATEQPKEQTKDQETSQHSQHSSSSSSFTSGLTSLHTTGWKKVSSYYGPYVPTSILSSTSTSTSTSTSNSKSQSKSDS